MRKLKSLSRNNYCFASEFVAARESAGFSLALAAKICARHPRTVSDWEAGKHRCPVWALRLITLQERFAEDLMGLRPDRGRTGLAMGKNRTTLAANDGQFTADEQAITGNAASAFSGT